jgi:hypothetical protein
LANVTHAIDQYRTKIDEDSVKIQALTKEVNKLKSDLNTQFSRLQHVQNAEAFKNIASATGSGYSPNQSPGRCAPDEVVVGLQPMQGGFDITFQCGKLPLLKVD